MEKDMSVSQIENSPGLIKVTTFKYGINSLSDLVDTHACFADEQDILVPMRPSSRDL